MWCETRSWRRSWEKKKEEGKERKGKKTVVYLFNISHIFPFLFYLAVFKLWVILSAIGQGKKKPKLPLIISFPGILSIVTRNNFLAFLEIYQKYSHSKIGTNMFALRLIKDVYKVNFIENVFFIWNAVITRQVTCSMQINKIRRENFNLYS